MTTRKKGLLLSILTLLAALCMLFAACGGDGITLKFDTNGAPAIESVEVTEGEEYTLPTPEWAGHTFQGWYENADFTGSAVTKVTATESKTFYAKWENLPAINLDLGGGSLEAGPTLYAKAGTNIAEFMKDYVPTYEGHLFGEWLVGDAPLADDASLTAEGVTLKAHYKVAYTIETNLQKLDQSGYEKGEDFTGYEYVTGTAFLPAGDVIKGFTIVAHEGSTAAKVLSDSAADNKFALWFDRNAVTLTLDPNFPADLPETAVAPETETIDAIYGQSLTLPAAYSFTGYALVGWSTAENGAKEFESDFIETHLYGEEYTTPAFTAEETCTLYAVWEQAYVDLFSVGGSTDYIFHFSADAKDIYLYRGGVLFLGTYQAGRFAFYGGDDYTLTGALNSDGTYVYYSENRAQQNYRLYSYINGVDQTVTLSFGNYNDLTYKLYSGSTDFMIDSSNGTYTVDDEGFYHVTYSDGRLKGQSFVYALVPSYSYFLVRDEQTYNWGTLYRGGYSEDGDLMYYPSVYTLTLDGFGVATLNTGSGTQTYYYSVKSANVLTLKSRSPLGSGFIDAGEAHIIDGGAQGTALYMIYDSDYDHTYFAENGEMLILDGISEASYLSSDSSPIDNGVFTLSQSKFGMIVHFISRNNGAKRTFLAIETAHTSTDEEGKDETTYTYSFRPLQTGYAEYTFMADGYIYSTLLLTLNDGAANTAALYTLDRNTGVYTKAVEGTYTAANGVYTFQKTNVLVEDSTFTDANSNELKLSDIKSFTFSLTTVQTSNSVASVMYMRSLTLESSTAAETYEKTYTSDKNAEDTLTVINGYYASFFYHTTDESGAAQTVTVEGIFSTGEDGISTLYDPLRQAALYFILHEEGTKLTFTFLDDRIGTLRIGNPDEGHASESMIFDGKGGATFTYTPAAEEGAATAPEAVTVEGTYTDTEEVTVTGLSILQFTSKDGKTAFRFIIYSSSSSQYGIKEIESEYEGKFTEKDGNGTLEFDGFGLYAVYSATGSADDGMQCSYATSTTENKAVRLSGSSRYYYFDLDMEHKTFTLRDEVSGSYFHVKNGTSTDLTFTLDGYGKLTVSKITEGATEDDPSTLVPIDEEGSYKFFADGRVELYYTDEAGESITLKGCFGSITSGGYSYGAIAEENREIENDYIDPDDLSVLVLDSFGNALRFGNDGSVDLGQYYVITDSLLYYFSEDGTDACIFTYDFETGIAQAVNNIERSYYNANFDALLFTRYGFMTKNGETRYYYHTGADGKVKLYRRGEEGEETNKYGFVESDFGTFDNKMTFDGTEYELNYSASLHFNRTSDNAAKYPVSFRQGTQIESLSFKPSGAREFADTAATVYIKDLEGKSNALTCTVRRAEDENGELHFYIEYNYFIFEIKLTYNGGNNAGSYEIVSMREEMVLYDAVYLNYFINYLFSGMLFPYPPFGVITLTTIYGEDGTAGTPTAVGEIDTIIGADTKGNAFTFEAEYTSTNGGFSVDFEGKDGYDYSIYCAIDSTYSSFIGLLGYGINAITRHETATSGDISVDVERIVVTESSSYEIGGYYDMTLTKGEKEIAYENVYILKDGTILYFARTRNEEDGKVTASTLYTITLKFKEGESIGPSEDQGSEETDPGSSGSGSTDPEFPDEPDPDDPDSGEEEPQPDIDMGTGENVPFIDSATITETVLTVAYTEDGANFVEYSGETAYFVYYSRRRYLFLADECTYDAATKTYTCKLNDRQSFVITIGEDGSATITLQTTENTQDA